ncbi:MAG: neutral zinc metallopeptidase [Leifsonia sp.]
MTFNDDADIQSGRVSKRGRNTAIGVGGGGLGLIAIVVISQLLGVDLTGLVGGTSSTPGSDGTPLTQCTTGAQANADIDCRMKAAAASLDAYWSGEVDGYTSPQPLVIFDGATDTGCGGATTDVGPFYCPNDQTIYIDTAFYDELRSQFGATGGPLAQLYVIAHEWGHHIQYITGIMNGLDLQQTGPTSDSVRLELQADCFAGAWVGAASTTKDVNGVTFLEPVTKAEIADALNAAAAVGDDHIQQATQGQVNPESFTHGTSAQREKWFNSGLAGGPQACDTFGATAANL